MEFVTASAHQLLQLQDVGGGAEGGGNHEGEQQLLRPAYQLGQQGVDFLLGGIFYLILVMVLVISLNNAMLLCGQTSLHVKFYKPQ